jgi:RHS repeat-associated protein
MLNANYDDKDKYTEKVTAYDKNGNIKKLQRYGNALIDNLTYTYNGNQLTKVKDESGNASGFTDGASAANEYTYDHNGNLTKDSNKNISNITYNVLNLPSTITFSDGSTITYSYAADGTKLRTVHSISGSSTPTQKDYCANVVYEDGVQKLLLTEEGYVDLSVTSPAYYYYLKDHQGNNRVVVSSGGTVAEVNHYYPFGGVFASSGNVQPYKYNGKELDTKKGLNWYDYGARHYDAALGRWFVVDPLAEKYYATTVYGYCLNNPVKFIDSDGRRVRPSNPVRRGYRNAGRPNPYAFYPGGVQPLSHRQTVKISYKGNGLYEQIALGEQNYVKNVTIGDNTVQMSRNNSIGVRITGGVGLLNNVKEFIEQKLDMVTETKYHIDGRISRTTNYTIKDPALAAAQKAYSDAYDSLSEQLGDDMTMLEKNAIIQKEIGLSPLMTIMMDMLNNPDAYKTESQKHIIPEFRQGY